MQAQQVPVEDKGMTDYRINGNDSAIIHEEQPAFPAQSFVDLKYEAACVNQQYKNFVVVDVNDHCVRLAVMKGEYRWHHHPHSDECFLALEGVLEIDLADGQTIHLHPGELFTIPAGVSHRTRSRERSVNLCFENRQAYTDVIFEDSAL
jgi:mannose-6-phosphate isomerase-like protein (cupin superfamily)